MKKKAEIAIFIAIILTASVFRLYHLDSAPPGLFADESINGNNAIEAIKTGQYKVFYPDNYGREGLFINLQSFSIQLFGNTAWALRVVSAICGILTVAGVYALARRLFNWQIAAISSFLMAVSFWHVVFSRIGFRAIMAPMLMVWAVYFLWRGLTFGHIWNFATSGVLFGLGMYTYISFRAMPLVILLVLCAYWTGIRKHFKNAKYRQTQKIILAGLILAGVNMLIVTTPLVAHFAQQPQDIFGRTSEISVFNSGNFIWNIIKNTAISIGGFALLGDFNWRHNIAGAPLLLWPVAAAWALGIIHSIYRLQLVYKKHGHFSTVHTLLLSWLIVGMLPVIFSNEGLPHALRSIMVAPAVFILAGQGMWVFYEFLERWYHARDVHQAEIILPEKHRIFLTESALIGGIAIFSIMLAVAVVEWNRYFNVWAKEPQVASSFDWRASQIAKEIINLPVGTPVYIISNTGYSATPIMFLTDSYLETDREVKNIHYISADELQSVPRNARLFDLR